MRIGIMQGRLVPSIDQRVQCFPRSQWATEFELAAQAGLDCIEWIYDLYGEDVNPLFTRSGVEQLKTYMAQTGIRILSVCADYFMDRPLIRVTGLELTTRMSMFYTLVNQCIQVGIERIVLPFVDSSKIVTDDELEQIAQTIRQLINHIEDSGVEVHLETSLAPERFVELLERINHSLVKVNYDSGNSASLGFRPDDEFSAYGKWVGSVHIKDRMFGGGTVPLGTGSTDFPSVFANLQLVKYSGDFILQAARGPDGEEIAWVGTNLDFLQPYFRVFRRS